MSDLFSLKDKTFLITGGTRGIGRAITLQFARAGARVLANYVRDQKSADTLQEEAVAGNLDILPVRADITNAKGVDTLEAFLEEKAPSLNGLVHCAATGVHKPVENLTLRHFDWTFNLNVRAFFDLVRRLLPRFGSGSSLVAVSSTGAVRAVSQYALVGSSKGALESLVRHLAAELAPRDIRVNALSPGTVRTEAWEVLPNAEERLEEACRRSPQGRLTTVEEVAQAAQFLCSDAAAGVVGHTLVVDGGKRIVE